MTTLTVHTDGGARGNPGPAAIGVVFTRDGERLGYSRCLGTATNNVAEYTALKAALELLTQARQHGSVAVESGAGRGTLSGDFSSVQFSLDSELVVRQVNRQYRVKDAGLLPLYTEVQRLLQELGVPWTVSHVPRAANSHADALVNQALDALPVA